MQFSRNGRKALLWAQVEAMRCGETRVEAPHLLLGLLHGPEANASKLLERAGVTVSEFTQAVRGTLPPTTGAIHAESLRLSIEAKKILEQAEHEQQTMGEERIGTISLLLAIVEANPKKLATVLATFGLTRSNLMQVLVAASDSEELESEETPAPVVPQILAHPGFMKGRSLCSVSDLTPEEIRGIFELTREIKNGKVFPIAQGKTLALLFEKPSLRTKVSFAVAITRLGGTALYLGKDEVGLGVRESIADVARGLSRWVDAVAVRTFDHKNVTELAANSTIPIINALTDFEHPCQALADYYTVLENRSQTEGTKFVFVGDGNNVAISLMLMAPKLGVHFTLCCPVGYEPPQEVIVEMQTLCEQYKTHFEIENNPLKAANDADVLYTDVWTSMGQEAETAKRLKDFAGFQIGEALLREAKEDVIILHCLPAHRGEEITHEAIESNLSKVWDEAENRLHVQQAYLCAVL
jgi:ornithine carbamoyltransferase